MRLFTAATLAIAVSYCAFCQTYTIQTFAGGGSPASVPGPSLNMMGASAVLVDGAGNLLFAAGTSIVRLDAATGVMTTVAGNGTVGYGGDSGPATGALLNFPNGIALDSAGNLFIADTFNNVIRKVSNGVITTVAGSVGTGAGPSGGYHGDNGPATSAWLSQPRGVAVDSAGNLYIADRGNNRIRKVSNGVITTVAGNGAPASFGDNGQAIYAALYYPSGVAVDSAGDLFIADSGNGIIRKVTNGVITTVAGNRTCCYSGDGGPATSAQLYNPVSVAVGSSGNLYISDKSDNVVRKVSNGVITTVAGDGTQGYGGDNGSATSARLNGPLGIALDSAGALYIADFGSHCIRKVSNGVITTAVGNGAETGFGDNGPATTARMSDPTGVALDTAGNLYVADTGDSVIRKVSNGVITTVVGDGMPGYTGDNYPAASAQLRNPHGVAVDSAGNLYIADSGNSVVRKVSNGVITTVAGTGYSGSSGDNGPATSAQLYNPMGVAMDSAGNLYIADSGNSVVREVSNGVIATVAGNGTWGYSGDGGPATSASVGPSSVAVDSAGNLYIADPANSSIRKVSNGIITTVAGNGTGCDVHYQSFCSSDGVATAVWLSAPTGVAVDSAGNLYIADATAEVVRKVSNGIMTTVAGNWTAGFNGDGGPATSAQLNGPNGVAVDSAGNVYVADSQNDRIRVLIPSGAACSASVTPTAFSPAASGGNLTVTVQTSSSCAWAIQSLPDWITFSGNVVGTGPANVTLSVALNSGGPRTATVSIAGVSVSVTQQSAAACTYSLSGFAAFPSAGATGSVGVSTASGCPWTASSAVSWITITGSSSGTGSGPVAYQVAANTGAERSDNLIVSGNTFTVEQAAAPALSITKTHSGNFVQGQSNATYTLMVTNASGAGSTTGTVTVTETPPIALALTSMAGAGWTCAANACTRSDPLAPGSSYQPVTVTVNVASNAASPQVNAVTVSGGGASTSQATDPTNIGVFATSGPSSLPAGQVGAAYAATAVTAIGGSGSYTWSATGLPAGLGIGAATGIISGTPTANSGSPYAVQVTATDSNSAKATRAYSLTINAAPANLPLVTGVSNAASGQAAIAPNTWVSIYGANFAAPGFSDDWGKSITDGNLPTTLDGVSVSVGGIPAYLSFVSAGQINVLTPNVASGSASVTVTAGAATTTPVTVTSQPFSPAFFPWPNGQPVATHLDYSWAVKNGTFAGATTVPAKPGEYIILWGTGFGPTNPTAPTGVTIPAGTTYYAANPVLVTIGSVSASVYGTALAPGFAGLYQVVAMVPATLSNGDYAVVATVGGVATATATFTVHN